MWLSLVPQCAVGHAGISHLFAPPSSAYRVNDRVQGGIQPYSLLTKKKERQRQPIKDRAKSESRSVMSDSLQPHGLYSPWNSPGLNTGVGSRSLLQWIFPTQGWNSGLPHCSQILYQLSHKGSPRVLEWVAYPSSSRSSRPGNQSGVSCIAGAGKPLYLPSILQSKSLHPVCTSESSGGPLKSTDAWFPPESLLECGPGTVFIFIF